MKAFKTSEGHYLRYHDMAGTKTPLLMIHGLGCSGSFDYPEVASQEAIASHRRILVDLLGAGFSDKPKAMNYTVSAHAKILCELIEYLELDHVMVFAHSLGGAVAIELAHLLGEKLTGLILSESNLDPSQTGAASFEIAQWQETDFVESGFVALVKSAQTGEGMWSATLSHWLPEAAHRLSVHAVKGGTPSWRTQLYALKCPKTFLFGEWSLPDPDVEVLAKAGLNVLIVPSAGHSMAWENPKGLAEAIAGGIKLSLE